MWASIVRVRVSPIRRYPSTSGWRPSGEPRSRCMAFGSATATCVSANGMSRTFANESIQRFKAKIAPVARAVARSYGKTLAATGTMAASRASAYIAASSRSADSASEAGEDVIDAGEEDGVGRPRLSHVPIEPRTDLGRGLTVDASTEHGPLRMGLHHPVRVLALRIALAVGRSFQRRTERRRARGRRIPEADDDDAPGRHGTPLPNDFQRLTVRFERTGVIERAHRTFNPPTRYPSGCLAP